MELRDTIAELMWNSLRSEYGSLVKIADAILAIPEIAEALAEQAKQKAVAEEYQRWAGAAIHHVQHLKQP